MKGDEWNHFEKLGLKRTSCASQFIISDTAGRTPNLVGKNTNMRSSKLNQVSHTPDGSYPFISSISFSSSSPISLSHPPSAKNISVRAEWLRQSGRAPSEPSERPRWRITPRPASIPHLALHIALRSPFRRFFSLCRSPILNKHSGIVANCDHTSEWVHWVHDCIGIAMGDAAKISPRVPSTLCSRSVGSWEDMMLPGREDPRDCADPRNLGQSEWDQKLGKIECEFSLYDTMSIYSGVCRIYTTRHSVHLRYPCISVQPPSQLEDVLDRACLRCTWRTWLSEFGYALGDWDRVNSEMHLET